MKHHDSGFSLLKSALKWGELLFYTKGRHVSLNATIQQLNDIIWSWPGIILLLGATLFCTIAFRFVQLRAFIRMWKETLFPTSVQEHTGDISPMQAFVNALSSSLGNGAIAGIAVAIYTGGPGAALWVLILGMGLMAVRFAEVYLSIAYGADKSKTVLLGGPMVYLKQVFGGQHLAYVYGLSCFIFGLIGGNAAQANSISLSFATTWGVPVMVAALVLFAFVGYVVLGGAKRIAQISDIIVPIKVIVFFTATGLVLVYHAGALADALRLIVLSGLSSEALAGGIVGFSLQQALRSGLLGVAFATEAGLGSSAILFGSSGSNDAVRSSLMAMLSTFISVLAAFIVALCIVVSGVWQSGSTSTALTIAAFNTVFGSFGGWIVSFLSVVFGIGVLVSYAYITRSAWLYLTNGRYEKAFVVMYCVTSFLGALVKVDIVWNSINVVMAVMLFINLFGIVCLTPRIARDLRKLNV